MLSSKLIISIVAVVVVSVVVIWGVVLIRPSDHTVQPTAQSVAPPTTPGFHSGKVDNSGIKGY
jgi:hypothetical protein